MKNLLLCTSILFLLFSCTSDSDFNLSEDNQIAINTSTENLISPENTSNPFDFNGKKYYDALVKYRQQNHYPNSIAEMTKQMAAIRSQFKKGSNTYKNVIPFTDEIVESIMDDPDNSMILIVQNSDLSTSAKTSLVNFLQGLIIQRQLSFSLSYDYIVDFEDIVIADSLLSDDDSETILTVTSISRYSLYSEVERKDHDWDKSSGNKIVKPFFETNEVAVISILVLLDIIK
jgi:hypothetical protein